MISISQISDAVQSYLAGVSLDSFEQWLAQQSWNMHLDSEPEVQRLVASIQMFIAELRYGHCSEAEFKQFLSDYFGDSVSISSNAEPIRRPRFSTRSVTIPFVLRQVAPV